MGESEIGVDYARAGNMFGMMAFFFAVKIAITDEESRFFAGENR